MKNFLLIQGEDFLDDRGKLRFFNDFKMLGIKRMYEIGPADTDTLRAWQGHESEQKWFYCSSGTIVINLVKVDDFRNPSPGIEPIRIELNKDVPVVVFVPGGYATGIKANDPNSQLLVFSDTTLEESRQDDFRYPVDLWNADW
ncbi:dTDP-6-deoxy-3,4-keto-hexulose isomerase [Zeaxanthinibacter enoshimensis]|uniref:dTDP-4-dehydrorhamnose 3,5-epimerase n=1 Tax=Zeaxanthinibacter enoshimensis TaxID=392009 RepID=A0A4R6TMS0_9FLAO|nr:dTDP-6-deoxy-3,4-keto-hexulose isomerase [Zeaxanthinibacter enoshimensis]TDQ31168.1 dTDP-4-dehydrorhamnose 3,5-epimerase [Zeaxanthinibacter enoshimensis]